MRKVQLAVVSVGPLSPSKINDFGYHYVILKNIHMEEVDGKPVEGKKYALNLQKRDNTKEGRLNYQNWITNLKPGAVIECYAQERNRYNVDQWKTFKVIKRADEAPKPQSSNASEQITNSKEAFIFSIESQLGKLQAGIKVIQEELDLYKGEA